MLPYHVASVVWPSHVPRTNRCSVSLEPPGLMLGRRHLVSVQEDLGR